MLLVRKSADHINYKDIGKRIQKRRKAIGMTQEELSDKTDLDSSTISRIENGSTKISLPSLVEIANILGLSADELLCGSVTASAHVYQGEMAERMKGCSDREVQILNAMNACLLEELRK